MSIDSRLFMLTEYRTVSSRRTFAILFAAGILFICTALFSSATSRHARSATSDTAGTPSHKRPGGSAQYLDPSQYKNGEDGPFHDTVSIHPELPTIVITIVRNVILVENSDHRLKSQAHYEMRIASKDRVMQTINDSLIQESDLAGMCDGSHPRLTVLDFNFDGYGDLAFTGMCGPSGVCELSPWLYNPATRSFHPIETLADELGLPEIDSVNRTLRFFRPHSSTGGLTTRTFALHEEEFHLTVQESLDRDTWNKRRDSFALIDNHRTVVRRVTEEFIGKGINAAEGTRDEGSCLYIKTVLEYHNRSGMLVGVSRDTSEVGDCPSILSR